METHAPRPWWNTNFTWSAEDIEKLKILAEANADLNRSAAALGRSATALCWKCRDSGIVMPPEWARLIKGS
ncbi:MAG: hypothetical protein WBD95_13660 [Xanthobacteraceae bacterium]